MSKRLFLYFRMPLLALVLAVFLWGCKPEQTTTAPAAPTGVSGPVPVSYPLPGNVAQQSSPTPPEPTAAGGYPPPAEPPAQVVTPTQAEGYPPPGETPTPGALLTPTPDAGGYPGPVLTPTSVGTPIPTPDAGGYPGPVQTPTSGGTAIPTATRGPGGVPTLSPTPFETPIGGLPTPAERPVTTAEPAPNLVRTISIWHSWDMVERLTLEDVLKVYQQFYPNVQFDVMFIPQEELFNRYQAASTRGLGPDILMGPAEWGPLLYDQNLVTDLGEIAQPEFLSAINPAALGEVRYKGALLGLPHSIRAGVLMFRNTQIFPNAPATLDELFTESRKVTKGGVVGAYLERSFFFSAAHLYALGGRLVDDNGLPAFNSQLGVDWLNLLKSLERGGAAEFNASRDLELFKEGKVGVIIDGSWRIDELAEAIGAENLAIDLWPAYGSGYLSGFVQTDNLYLNPSTLGDDQYASLQFMGFFLAREVQAILTRAGHIPSVMDVEVEDPLMQQAMLAFEGGTPFPIHPGIEFYWDPLQTALKAFLQEGMQPQEALNQAAEGVRRSLEQTGEHP